MQIRCKQFECEVCHKVTSIQIFYNSNGIKYGRARHYLGLEKGKPQFEYHKQSLEYIAKNLGHDSIALNVDLEKAELSSKRVCMAGGKGFEPLTLSLEG
jgi:hypothetical protein